MTLNHQSNILVWVAAVVVAVLLTVARFSVIEVRNQNEQITMAESTVKGITNLRFLVIETAFYNESRTTDQWRTRSASFAKTLASLHYSEDKQNALLSKVQANYKVISHLYARLVKKTTGPITQLPEKDINKEFTASTVSALFLATQEMLDDSLELVRLNRLDLARAQANSELVMQISIAVLAMLILLSCMIIKRRVLIPIAALQLGAKRVTKGDLAFRLNLTNVNEIGALANTFDHMTEALQHARDTNESTLKILANKSIELTHTQQQLQTIIDHVPALVGSWDVNFHNRFANRAYSEWFGITPDKMRGKHMSKIIGKDRFAEIEPYLLSVLKGNPEVFERSISYSSGETRHAVFSNVPDVEDGVIKGFFGFVSDVTQLKQAQIEKERVLRQLQGIVDAAHDFAIIAGDIKGTIILFSKGAEKLLGYKAGELVGKTNPSIFHVREEVVERGNALTLQFGRQISGFDAFVELARQGQSESREWTYVRKDGTTLPVNLTVTAIRDEAGSITGYLGIAKDIRKDKEILQTLAETRDKAQAASLLKSQFLANMSHEIRTPMNAILGMLQLLQHTDLTTRQLDYAIKTQSAAQSLLGLLNDILDFSKIEADKMTLEFLPFRLDTLMRDLSVIFASSIGDKDIEVLFSIDPKVPDYIVGDVMRLRQVIINLASNAIKFTHDGEVVISLKVQAQDTHHTEILFAVQDSGIGIGFEQLAYIFEGFSQAEASTTRRFGGTGLGLAISQRLVSLMGGELAVESTLGVGSRFHFTLKFQHSKDDDDASTAASIKRLPDTTRRALIVDDSDSAREVLLSMVESLGWHGDAVASGFAALTMLQKSESDQFPYDVVFMDWRMPEMDGWETTRRIRQLQHGDQAPIIIMVTAHGREILAERLQNERHFLNGFLVKPVTASMLFDAVSDSINEPKRIAAKSGVKRLTGLRLLVVEDTPVNRQVAQELLSNEGAHVEVAESGSKGVEKTLAAKPPFDAVLMDIQMPDMDGYVATRMIRKNSRMQLLPILAMTANVMAADKEACFAAGMNDHIAKPIDLEDLVKTILRHCHPNQTLADISTTEAVTMSHNKLGIEFEAALKRLGDNKSLFASLAQRFGADVAPIIVDLRQNLEQKNQNSAASVMHTLKGIAGTVGAVQLMKYATEIEVQLKFAADAINIDETVNGLESLIAETREALELIALDLSPKVSHSSAKIQTIDKSELAASLNELDILLQDSNMKALNIFADLEKKYGGVLDDGLLSQLANALNRLDFKQALKFSQQLRTRLQ